MVQEALFAATNKRGRRTKKEDEQETVPYVNFSKFVQAESGNDDFLRKQNCHLYVVKSLFVVAIFFIVGL